MSTNHHIKLVAEEDYMKLLRHGTVVRCLQVEWMCNRRARLENRRAGAPVSGGAPRHTLSSTSHLPRIYLYIYSDLALMSISSTSLALI